MPNLTTLDPRFHRLTPSGEPNLIWAISKYFIRINDDHKVNEDNRRLYISDYNNTICPLINPCIPVSEYTDQDISSLFVMVIANSDISEDTFSRRHRHLIIDPIEYYRKDHSSDDDPSWGEFYRFNDGDLGMASALRRVQRSFSDSEAKALKEALLSGSENMPGELAGLSVTLYTGARLNEAAGLNYSEIIPMTEYPGEYKIMLGAKTTQLHKSDLKLSGKTRNAPRIVPLLDIHASALIRRMRYIESKLAFPLEDENGYFRSVLDLPIACVGSYYSKRCSADQLSKAGSKLFREVLRFDENRMAGLNQIVLGDHDIYTEDISATSYTCRRDYATELDTAFIDEHDHMTYLQYCMGHEIENKRFRRNDLTDEYYLHIIKVLLEKSHRVNYL